MNLLLLHPTNFLGINGGARKANREILSGLARLGHRCRVVTRAFPPQPIQDHVVALAGAAGERRFEYRGLSVRMFEDTVSCESVERPEDWLREEIEAFEPECILVSEDAQMGSDGSFQFFRWLDAALEVASAPVVFLTHAPATLPFGPFAVDASRAAEKLKILRRAAGVVTFSRFMQNYLKDCADLPSHQLYYPCYGSPPFPRYGSFEDGAVGMINASRIKGIDIFLALADAFPETSFAAVPGWATTEMDLEKLVCRKNVRLIDQSPDIESIYKQLRILLVPSRWHENFPLVVGEAMLRGIPVVASDDGGLEEAKLGVDYVIPVSPATGYNGIDPILPEQGYDLWVQTLGSLLKDRATYERVSRESRDAAYRFVEANPVEAFDALFRQLSRT